MKGYKVIKPFKHDRHYKIGEFVNINSHVNNELAKKGLVRWYDRPDIVFPVKKTLLTW